MKKIIRLTEQDLVRLVRKIVKEQPDEKFDTPYNKEFMRNSKNKKTNTTNINTPTNFKAMATVEDDMVMEFSVINFTVDGDRVDMFIIDPVSKKRLYVTNFDGPIYDPSNSKVVYKNSIFQNVNKRNYNQIAKSKNIPVEFVME
jgi:hypothetical protein